MIMILMIITRDYPQWLHTFFYKNILIFAEAQTFLLLFLNFHCSLAILSLNILIDCILIKKSVY